ncbi:MAG: glycerate kinase [Oscillospiraceae bacterium]|nr:glycerate kinase [Oscillospiraceae bacterium]
MKVVVAIDSFKGSLTSVQAGNAVKEAVLQVDPNANVVVRPLADGGEGTVDALSALPSAEKIAVTVTGPLGTPVDAQYCIIRNKNMAVIEMAAAAGLPLVPAQLRNPLNTTTYGVGELIKDAICRGCRDFLIGIGGSATNDGGTGMLSALGYHFLDESGSPISLGAQGLENLHSIDDSQALKELHACKFRVACDVNNPLCGNNGCSAVFAPQKGGTPEMIAKMDSWLKNYAKLTKTVNAQADENLPGAGAAGGLGFAFSAFLNASLEPGISIVLDETNLEDYIKDADVVVTGEGRLDAQTVMGKAPIGVAKLAKKYAKKVIAFSGCVADGAEICNEHGIDAFFPALRQVSTLAEAMERDKAYKNLKDTAYQVFRLLIL